MPDQDSNSSTDTASSDDSSGSSSQSDSGKSDNSGSSSDGNQKKNGLEWVVFAIGVAIVFGVIGYLTYQLITESSDPPLLAIELGEQTQRDKVVEIEVTVRNEGDMVAEGATVEVCGGPETCAQLTFTYIPAKSERTGRVGLNTPLAGPLETRAVSFKM